MQALNEPVENSQDLKSELLKKPQILLEGSLREVWKKMERRWEGRFIFEERRIKSTFTGFRIWGDSSCIPEFWRDLRKCFLSNSEKNLRRIEFSFRGFTYLKKHDLDLLGTHILRNLYMLQEIKLDFGSCGSISNKILQTILSDMGLYLIHLKRFKLDCELCPNISGEIFSNNELRNFWQLEEFELSFSSDRGFERLMSRINKNLRNLTKLRLNFSGCVKITDKVLQSFATDFESTSLTKLKHFTISLNGCEKITDKGLISFGNKLSRCFPLLQHLDLDFGWCNEITDIGVDELGSAIVLHLTNLKKLVLKFLRCLRVTSRGKAMLRHKMSSIPKFILH